MPQPPASENGRTVGLDTSVVDLPAMASPDAAVRDQAWHRVVTTYGARLRGYAHGRVRNRPTNEEYLDVAAKTWEALFRMRDRFETPEQFAATMFQIAARRGVDVWRRPDSGDVLESSLMEVRSQNGEKPVLLEDRGDPAGNFVQDILDGQHNPQLVSTLLQGVKGRQREVLELAVVQGRSHGEIAEIIGTTEGSSRITLARALARARSNLVAIVTDRLGLEREEIEVRFPALRADKRHKPRSTEPPAEEGAVDLDALGDEKGDKQPAVGLRRFAEQMLDAVADQVAEEAPDKPAAYEEHMRKLRQAHFLFRSGMPIQDIAAEMGVSPAVAEAYVASEARRLASQTGVGEPALKPSAEPDGSASPSNDTTAPDIVTGNDSKPKAGPGKQGLAFDMHFDGVSLAEIAKALGVTEATAQNYIYRENARRAEAAGDAAPGRGSRGTDQGDQESNPSVKPARLVYDRNFAREVLATQGSRWAQLTTAERTVVKGKQQDIPFADLAEELGMPAREVRALYAAANEKLLVVRAEDPDVGAFVVGSSRGDEGEETNQAHARGIAVAGNNGEIHDVTTNEKPASNGNGRE